MVDGELQRLSATIRTMSLDDATYYSDVMRKDFPFAPPYREP
jgi:hypothetical protein